MFCLLSILLCNVKISNARKILVVFKKKGERPRRRVVLTRQAADGIVSFAKTWHPNEAILILQGKKEQNVVTIDGLVIPPFSANGPFYSGFSLYDLPLNGAYIGTAHSHPGASDRKSVEDLNHFFGLVSVIISFPYEDRTIGAWDR